MTKQMNMLAILAWLMAVPVLVHAEETTGRSSQAQSGMTEASAPASGEAAETQKTATAAKHELQTQLHPSARPVYNTNGHFDGLISGSN